MFISQDLYLKWNMIDLNLNAIHSFLKMHLGQAGPDTADVEALRLQVSELQQKVEQLQDENKELKGKVMTMSESLQKFCTKTITWYIALEINYY